MQRALELLQGIAARRELLLDAGQQQLSGGVERDGFQAAVMILRTMCSLRSKKWPAPGTTDTGSSMGKAQSSTRFSGTVSSSSP